jgi:hypothetical protein
LSKLVFVAALSLTAISAAPQKGATDADEKEATNFRLTNDNFNKYATATTALMKVTQNDPALRKQVEESQQGKSLAQAVTALDKYPAITAPIHSAGLSTREYIVMTATIVSSTMAVGMKKQGMIKEIPSVVSPENAAFVEQNYEKISALMQKIQAANK